MPRIFKGEDISAWIWCTVWSKPVVSIIMQETLLLSILCNRTYLWKAWPEQWLFFIAMLNYQMVSFLFSTCRLFHDMMIWWNIKINHICTKNSMSFIAILNCHKLSVSRAIPSPGRCAFCWKKCWIPVLHKLFDAIFFCEEIGVPQRRSRCDIPTTMWGPPVMIDGSQNPMNTILISYKYIEPWSLKLCYLAIVCGPYIVWG